MAAPACAQTQTGLLGDIGGLRTELGNHGVTLGIIDSENLLGNLSGGIKTGATLQGVTTTTLQIDTGKAFNLPGGTLDASFLQIHGHPLTPLLDNIQTENGNDADNATRLWELWYDQAFDGGKADIKIGQQSIDNEFIVSQYSLLFVNTGAGWPMLPSYDLYAGGPAYPLSSLGARIAFKPTGQLNLLAGVFDDNPPGGPFLDDPQSSDAGGTRFNLNTGALFIAELQYTTRAKLAATYRFGFWVDTGAFPDQEYGTDGLSLANPASNGVPIMHRGNYSLYAVMDQPLLQMKSGATLGAFARIMGAPSDQNLITLAFNGGFTLAAPFPSRPNDTAGIDFGLVKVSDRAAHLDRDANVFSPTPIRGTEEIIELTYQAPVTGWLTLQPDLQYVINPGANIDNPDTGRRLHNELIAGARGVVSF